jgi:hypothetical protein
MADKIEAAFIKIVEALMLNGVGACFRPPARKLWQRVPFFLFVKSYESDTDPFGRLGR